MVVVFDNHQLPRLVCAVDPLTGLPTRKAFAWRLAHALRQIDRSRAVLALLHMDLDRMASVNAILGGELGNRVVQVAAERMTRALPGSATLGRLQSDDFAAFLQVSDLGQAVDHAVAVLEHCRAPYIIECLSMKATVSIGIALCASPAESPASLMARAKRALMEAKMRGGDGLYPGAAIRP